MLQSFVGGHTFTNSNFSAPSRRLLCRIIGLWHMVLPSYPDTGAESDHVPDLSTFQGLQDLFVLCAFIQLLPATFEGEYVDTTDRPVQHRVEFIDVDFLILMLYRMSRLLITKEEYITDVGGMAINGLCRIAWSFFENSSVI